ncbi:MAG: hypothetical protein U1C74_02220, partial [Phenylobacterium sp.]|nr:hypothetical protein [Phenylobacterium sp.]
ATGDHPSEEQLANADLFVAAPALLAAARIGRKAVADDLRLTIEAHTVPRQETLEPDLATLEEIAKPIVKQLTMALAAIDSAIALAGVQS